MPVRPLYECTVLLSGSRDNSVFLPGVTAVEMYVLRALHGKNESGTDPITNVKMTGKGVERTDEQERARIGARYNRPGDANGITVLNTLYGVGNRLPLRYEVSAPEEFTDAPLAREEETLVDLPDEDVKLEGPITSVPPPRKARAASVLEQ